MSRDADWQVPQGGINWGPSMGGVLTGHPTHRGRRADALIGRGGWGLSRGVRCHGDGLGEAGHHQAEALPLSEVESVEAPAVRLVAHRYLQVQDSRPAFAGVTVAQWGTFEPSRLYYGPPSISYVRQTSRDQE